MIRIESLSSKNRIAYVRGPREPYGLVESEEKYDGGQTRPTERAWGCIAWGAPPVHRKAMQQAMQKGVGAVHCEAMQPQAPARPCIP
jgi:hypothetical protein